MPALPRLPLRAPLSDLRHGLELCSAYASSSPCGTGSEPECTNALGAVGTRPAFAGCLDYVWFSKRNLSVVALLAVRAALPRRRNHGPHEQESRV